MQALQAALEKARKEAKAKGDLARKMLEEKDREIASLRTAIEAAASQRCVDWRVYPTKDMGVCMCVRPT